MILLAIDPGPEKSGVVGLEDGKILLSEEADMDRVRWLITGYMERAVGHVVCEDVTPQMTIGVETLDTKERVGEIKEMCRAAVIPFTKIARRDVKAALALGKANDSVVVEELKSRGWIKGTKKSPGTAYGVSGHCWQALAIAVAFLEMQKEVGMPERPKGSDCRSELRQQLVGSNPTPGTTLTQQEKRP